MTLRAGRHALRDVIDKVALMTATNHLVDPSRRAAACELQADVVVTDENALSVLSALALDSGLALVPLSPAHGLYEWIDLRGPRRHEVAANAHVVTPKTALRLRDVAVAVTVARRLEKLDAIRAGNLLRPQFAGSTALTIGAVDAKVLVVTGLAPDIARVLEVLDEHDVPD